jgi:hypothetical protein
LAALHFATGSRRGEIVIRLSFVLAFMTCVTACSFNAVRDVGGTDDVRPDTATSVVIVGVGIEGFWPWEMIRVRLDEYSIPEQRLTRGCFRQNHIAAFGDSESGKVSYSIFRVPAGHYVLDAREVFLRIQEDLSSTALRAPAGKIVYFGDFVYVGDLSKYHKNSGRLPPGALQRRDNLAAARAALKDRVVGEIVRSKEAKNVPVRGNLCITAF